MLSETRWVLEAAEEICGATTSHKGSKGSTCGQAIVGHCQKFHVQTQLWERTLESAWQVGEETLEIFLFQETFKSLGITQTK